MEVFSEYLERIDHPDHRDRMEEVFVWIMNTFPSMDAQMKWNTPMFTNNGTYIIGFSTAKHHMSVSPEEVCMTQFADQIGMSGYSATKGLYRIPWNEQMNYDLLERMIAFNIMDKASCSTFWRK